MNIQKATKKCMEIDGYITRKSWGGRFSFYLEPTNTPLCCIADSHRVSGPHPRWNPNADDLMADDWIVMDENSTPVDE